MRKTLLLLSALLLSWQALQAQTKQLTMEEAVLGYELYPGNKFFQWQGELNAVACEENGELTVEPVEKGRKRPLIGLEEFNNITGESFRSFPAYRWLEKNTIVVLRPTKYHTVDLVKNRIVTTDFPQGAGNVTPNDKGAFAYTRENNLYYINEHGREYRITNDTDPDMVNGRSVSRDEMGIRNGIFWSPDGKKIAFYRKDESRVGVFPLLDITTRTGALKNIKYPMAGMDSERISLGVYDLETQRTVFVKATDFDEERYLTNITWSPRSDMIYIQVVNRAQNHIKLNQYNAATGDFIKTLLEERNDKYVEPSDKLVFLDNDAGKFLYRTDNRDGYRNLYLCDTDGRAVRRLTDVDASVVYVGQDGRHVYYTSAEVSPIESHLFRVEIKSGRKTRLTTAPGWHTVSVSRDGKYFIDSYSSFDVPRVITLNRTSDGQVVKTLFRADNPTKEYNYGEITLGTLKSADGRFDNYYRLIKPMNFDPVRKYPVLVYVYGGPHSQMVKNTWQGELRHWEMLMAQRGYVVMVMDNRGTENRGAEYEKAIHRQCGQVEMADQMKGIEFLKAQPWVDADRIGVHGWSYGGFMTISLITNHPDVFKVAVAGGPVIDWKWYEVMYGERYMDSPARNPEGYEKVSLMNQVKNLKGKLLICQGAMDNTVLWQHSLNFVQECVRQQVQVDYFPYPLAEHNVFGRDRIHLMQKITDYFEAYLK